MGAADSSVLVRSGDKIGFLGDSITEQGAAPSGYINLVIMGLNVAGVDAVAIPAGVSGNTSGNMRSRVGPHVIAKGANWLTLSCGVNDVGMKRKGRGVELEEFKKNVSTTIEQALTANLQVMLLTTTVLGEDIGNERNAEIAPYNDYLRALAKEKHLVLADVNAAYQEVLKTPLPSGYSGKPDHRLLADDTHPNQEGQTLMAKTILLAFGVPASDFPRIEKEWMENPRGKGVKVGGGTLALISQKQFLALEKISKARRTSVRGIVEELWAKALPESTPKDGAVPASASTTEAAQSRIGALVEEYIQTTSS